MSDAVLMMIICRNDDLDASSWDYCSPPGVVSGVVVVMMVMAVVVVVVMVVAEISSDGGR